jgi:hypothetical protein
MAVCPMCHCSIAFENIFFLNYCRNQHTNYCQVEKVTGCHELSLTISPSHLHRNMLCSTPNCDISADTSSNIFALYSSSSLRRNGHHLTDALAIQSFVPSYPTLTQDCNENDRWRLAQFSSPCTNGENRFNRVIAILDAALEIVGEPSDNVALSNSDELSILVNDRASSRVRPNLDGSDKNHRGGVVARKQ